MDDATIYVAVAVIVGLLICLIAIAVSMLQQRVLRNIRSKTIGLVSVYDDLLEEKSQQLATEQTPMQQVSETQLSQTDTALVNSIDEMSSAIMGMAERHSDVVFKSSDSGSIYNMIRYNFSFNVNELINILGNPKATHLGPATATLQQLDYDTVYQLSTLTEDDMVFVINDTFSPEMLGMVNQYLTLHEKFDILRFYDFVKGKAELEFKDISVKVPAHVLLNVTTDKGVTIIPDDTLCEGFQVEAGPVLYDYSLKTRDID